MPTITFQNMRVCCDKCQGMITRRNLKTHQKTKKCNSEFLRIQQETNVEEQTEAQEEEQTEVQGEQEEEIVEDNTIFTVFGAPIEKVHEFKYLGRIVTDTDDDKATVIYNLKKATKIWGTLHRLISFEKTQNLQAAVSVYQSIIESILLYGSETWVLRGCTNP